MNQQLSAAAMKKSRLCFKIESKQSTNRQNGDKPFVVPQKLG
jgi:hypothetical protein